MPEHTVVVEEEPGAADIVVPEPEEQIVVDKTAEELVHTVVAFDVVGVGQLDTVGTVV